MVHTKIYLLISQERMEEAESLIREELATDIENAELFGYLAISLLGQGRTKEALDTVERAIELEPDSDQHHFTRAKILVERKDYRNALKSATEAVRLDPEDPSNHGLQGCVLACQGKSQQAKDAVERGLSLDPENEDCRYYQSIILGSLQKNDDAKSASLAYLSDEPDGENAHSARGWVLVQAGEGKAAEEHFMETLRIAPANEDARSGLAEALKLQHPVMNVALRFLRWFHSLPAWIGLLALIGSAQLSSWALASPVVWVSWIGYVAVRLIILFVVFMVANGYLSDAAIFFTPKGRLTLSDIQKRCLAIGCIPFVIGSYYLIDWALRESSVSLATGMGWVALVAFMHELCDHESKWVQRKMWQLTALLAAVMIACELVRWTILLPEALDFLAHFAAEKEFADANEVEFAMSPELKAKEQHFFFIRKFVVYPAFAILLIGCYADDVAEFLYRRAPDE